MARGIDAEKVDVVVNLDLPTEKDPTPSAGVASFSLATAGNLLAPFWANCPFRVGGLDGFAGFRGR